MNAVPLVAARLLSKRFPGVQALSRVSLEVFRGEVVAVIGENGAGKSTLMKILAGVETPDDGEIRLDGRPVTIDSVRAAQRLGIALIHQELNLADNLDVGANIFLGREPRRFGFIDRRRIARDSLDVLRQVGADWPPRTICSTLSIGRQQMVEIAKALSVNARVLIMDEPTSSLTLQETGRLFRVINDLRRRGVSIVYISHRLGEVKELADRVVVLRDGQNAGDLAREEIDHDRMVKLMVGRDVSQYYVRSFHPLGEVVLEARALRVPGRGSSHPLSFAVRAGEIVGVAGLVGAGRTELLRVLFGVDRPEAGAIHVAGKSLAIRGPSDAIRAGLALVPEDRKAQGLIMEMAVRENLSLASLAQNHRAGFLDRKYERRLAVEMISRLNVKTPSPEQITQFLSGGNQQKIVLGKWLALKPKVLLLDEPTRGIDVGAKQEIYRLIEQLAAEGVAVLFVSSEMEEVLCLPDRVLVMHEGQISGELTRRELNEEAVMQLATGRLKKAE